ncbi:cardiolipin synthase [Lachnospiraceae bacterium XBD2001]|nr:cardiolipin synthase [Lachnospiraceae bacterium XBD2001]
MKKLTYEKKASIKNGTGRMVVSLLVFLLEAVFLMALFTWLNDYVLWVSFLTRVVSILIVLGLYASRMTSNIKTPWIILILAVPIVGVGIFLIVGLNGKPYAMRKRYQEVDEVLMPLLMEGEHASQSEDALVKLEQWDDGIASISKYIVKNSGYPLYQNSDITYYSSAEEGFAAQKEAMKDAKNFIFLEYHAIEDDILWNGIQEILEDKVREGVEVRVFYDDMGSIGFINTDFIKRLAAVGIECRVFNPFVPGLNLFLNNRDHRKITVIDGVVGFTGGYNIANEYCNITHPFGMWKDTGVRIEGEAVRSLTITFLENWHAIRKSDCNLVKEEIQRYLPEVRYQEREQSAFVQPYADTPLDNEQVGEEVYISIINNAKKYCWFITPYLIISDEMIHALNLAAKRGVDVRIITPGIPDKKLVYYVTRSYYSALTNHGIRIYEWTPGFCHCKMCVSDDKVATCGTINLDYRSLYHHFENGCMYMNCQAVMDTKRDFESMFAEARDVTEDYIGAKGMLKLGQQVLRLVAVLL